MLPRRIDRNNANGGEGGVRTTTTTPEPIRLPSRRTAAAAAAASIDAPEAAHGVSSHVDEEELPTDDQLHAEDVSTFRDWSEWSDLVDGGDVDDDPSHSPSSDDLPSLLFGGSSSNFESISLWNILWKGLDWNLTDWNIDISGINHTFTQPSEESEKRIAYQKMWRTATATNSQITSMAPSTGAIDEAAIGAAIAAGLNPSAGAPALPSTPYRTRQHAPIVSVLHDLRSQQGIAPFMTFTPDSKLLRLTLVHSFFARGDGDDDANDVRGDGLIEWFVRPAAPLLYPLTTAPPPPSAQATSDSASGFSLWSFPGSLFASFPLDGHVRGSVGGGPRRRLVGGDWTLQEWRRINGIIHAQANTNMAGNIGRESEQEFTIVAYECFTTTSSSKDDSSFIGEEDGQVMLQIFFQPLQASSSMYDRIDSSLNDPSSANMTRLNLTIPLRTLRIVTAISITSSRLSEADAERRATAKVLYALRGDKRVFRSIKVEAVKEGEEWKVSRTNE